MVDRSQGIRSSVRWDRSWVSALDTGARYPFLGAGLGLILLAICVPLLIVAGGRGGTLEPSVPLLLLVPVVVASTLSGRVVGVIIALIALVCWDWFFIPPLHTITISYLRDGIALIVFLAVALLTGQLASITSARTEEALLRARTSNALYELSVALIARREVTDILATLADSLRLTFGLKACAVLRDTNERWRTVATAGELPPELRVETSQEIAGIATSVAASGRATGSEPESSLGERPFAAALRSRENVRFLPLRINTRSLGVLELIVPHGIDLDAEQRRLIATFANGAAIALEQARLAQEERAAMVARESDELKSALLSSVSHDLRTPLAGIKAAASSLLQEDVEWTVDDQRAFITDINSEADRLARLVSNLLDLSRIDAGEIRLEKQWEDAIELIQRVVARFRRQSAAREIHLQIQEGLPQVSIDALRIEQALSNLLENADKYSPAGASLCVLAGITGAEEKYLKLSVMDRGPGIPADEQASIFGKFYRVRSDRKRNTGTGLGLAIVKGFVEAHGGTVVVESKPGQGSTFSMLLPLEEGELGMPEDAE